MRIAFIYDSIPPWKKGGIETRLFELSMRLTQLGHEVHFFGLKWWNGKRNIEINGVYYHGVGNPRELYINGRRSISEAIYFARRLIYPLIRESNIDVIDCQEFPYFSCFSSKFASYVRSIPLMITWHEVWRDYWADYLGKLGIFGKFVEKSLVNLSVYHIAVSRKTKRDLHALGVRNIKLLSNGIDFTKIQRVPSVDEEWDIIFAGRLIKEKNVALLIKALSLLKMEIPDISAVIIGDGPEREKLEALTRQLDLTGNVEFKGFLPKHEDVIAHMKSSKVFVFPTVREGFGISALEANASGIPVVTTSHPMNAAKDLIIDGKNGFLAKPIPEDFSEKILYVLAHSSRKMKKGSLNVAKKYDWEYIVRDYVGYLETIV
ncbi:glycosyltransferase family 4 protein [Thermococcus sp. 9N3]|uniref:glycosyltransferase family 4 protein n=1 Tax=Thermococcus sp. 9N3 TaxID=163002 RepID=UPI00197F4E66|nr:glycosyltransferase family 4 protein [Thermococcus sp. 9N3]